MNNPLQQALQDVEKLFKNGEIDEAAKACRKVVKRFSKKVEPCVALAQIENVRGQKELMHDALALACKRDPKNISLKEMRGDAYMRSSQYKKAADIYRSALKQQPNQLSWKARLGAALQELPDHLDEAIKIHRQVISLAPNEAIAHYNLGTALKRKHEFQQALEAYKTAAKLAPKDVDIRYSLGNLLFELELFEETVDELNEVLSLKPDFPLALDQLSYANKKLLRTEASVHAAERLVKLAEKDANAMSTLAEAYLANKDYNPALASCEKGLELNPKNRRLLASKTVASAALNKQEKDRPLFDLDNLLSVTQVDTPENYNSIDDFNHAIVEHINNHPTLDFSGVSHSCFGGSTSNEIFTEPLGPIGELRNLIANAVRHYREKILERADHPWCSHLPSDDNLNISGWVTQLQNQGYQNGHIHPTGWISGVYYVSLPPEFGGEKQAGCIEFGRTPSFYPDGDQGEIRVVEPSEGTLVLFPSYFYHRTIPFESEHQRITIAFDFRTDDFS
jgi:tetratricopeptide (TPR) repeat protein